MWSGTGPTAGSWWRWSEVRALCIVAIIVLLLSSAPAWAGAPVERIVLVAEYVSPGGLVRVFELRYADGSTSYNGQTISFGSDAAGRSALELKRILIRDGQGYLLELPPGTEIAPQVLAQWQREGYDAHVERVSASRPRPREAPVPPAPAPRVTVTTPQEAMDSVSNPAESGHDRIGQVEDAEAAIHPGDDAVEDIARQDREAQWEARKAAIRSWFQAILDWLVQLWHRVLRAVGIRV